MKLALSRMGLLRLEKVGFIDGRPAPALTGRAFLPIRLGKSPGATAAGQHHLYCHQHHHAPLTISRSMTSTRH
jgi:hypothetical protein